MRKEGDHVQYKVTRVRRLQLEPWQSGLPKYISNKLKRKVPTPVQLLEHLQHASERFTSPVAKKTQMKHECTRVLDSFRTLSPAKRPKQQPALKNNLQKPILPLVTGASRLVAKGIATGTVILLVVMPEATIVLAPSSDALCS